MLKPSVEEQWGYDLTQSMGHKLIRTFPKGISPKMIVIAWLDFELALYAVTTVYVSNSSVGSSTFFKE